jgi:hypothetical protein
MLKMLIPLVTAGSLMVASAAVPSIGFVKSTGEFRLDGSAVRGNGTVFEGNLVETSAARSVIQLASTQVTLSPQSSARVYRDRIVLEKGTASVKDGIHQVIEANTLRIVPSTQDSVVQIEISGPSRVKVSALGGAAEVRNSSGVLTASLRSGMSLAFSPQAGGETAVRMTGVIESHNGVYTLTDETTKVTVQLVSSPDVARNVGKRVAITGSSVPGATLAGGASQLVRTVTVTNAAAAGAGGAAAAGGSAAGAGLSGGAIGAIVGGVAVGGTLGGLAAAGTFSSSEPVSR